MSVARVILVHLRRPNRSNPKERRDDPFFEFGSFGCTGCHKKNLMNPKRAEVLDGVRLGFAQGGKDGCRLVHLTPPVRVVTYHDRCELIWEPVEMPFKYSAAPILVDNEGNSDFPALLQSLHGVDRATWLARFSSAFRSRRSPLEPAIADNICRVYDRRRRAAAQRDQLARTYVDALPYAPNTVDPNRHETLMGLRAQLCKRSHIGMRCSRSALRKKLIAPIKATCNNSSSRKKRRLIGKGCV